jgi:hypothetical protein
MFFPNSSIFNYVIGVWLPKCKESGEACRVRFEQHLDRSGMGEPGTKQSRITQSFCTRYGQPSNILHETIKIAESSVTNPPNMQVVERGSRVLGSQLAQTIPKFGLPASQFTTRSSSTIGIWRNSGAQLL